MPLVSGWAPVLVPLPPPPAPRYSRAMVADQFEQPNAPPPATPRDVSSDPDLPAKIRRLVLEQPYGVLCTQGHGQPYASLVALAFSSDLRHAVFVTPRATRKYRLLVECDRVALLIDNRSQHHDDMMSIEALTVTGQATEITDGATIDSYADLLIERHPQLRAFVTAASCALFRIRVIRCLHVSRFQEVGQWVPRSD